VVLALAACNGLLIKLRHEHILVLLADIIIAFRSTQRDHRGDLASFTRLISVCVQNGINLASLIREAARSDCRLILCLQGSSWGLFADEFRVLGLNHHTVVSKIIDIWPILFHQGGHRGLVSRVTAT